MNKGKPVLILVILAFITSCAFEHGLTKHLPKEIKDDYCYVTVIRNKNLFGSGVPVKVILNRRIIAHINIGEYFTFSLKPGTHNFGVAGGSTVTPILDYDFESHKKYYFLIGVSPDLMGPDINQINEKKAKEWLKESDELTKVWEDKIE